MLRYYGHQNVKILNGGFKEWKKLNYETVKEKAVPRVVKADLNGDYSYSINNPEKNISNI